MERFQNITDLFTITCKICGFNDVELTAERCECCCDSVVVECNSCGSRHDSHDFIIVETEDP